MLDGLFSDVKLSRETGFSRFCVFSEGAGFRLPFERAPKADGVSLQTGEHDGDTGKGRHEETGGEIR
jgi:hypothetical protein